MHAEAFAFVAHVAGRHPARRVYEIGSRNINGTVRGLFRDATQYVGVDIMSGPDVDLVADAATYMPPMAPDTVVCCEVLEHTPAASAIVVQAATVLEPGGLLIITCASDGRDPHSALDGGPVRPGEYYRNLGYGVIAEWADLGGVEPLDDQWPSHPGDCYFVGQKRDRV